jgi:uncharacterized OB-fold protein
MESTSLKQDPVPGSDGAAFTAPAAQLAETFASLIAMRQLWIPRCPITKTVLEFSARICPDQRNAEIEWIRASGAATLHTFTTYWHQYHADFPVPYNVAMVELEEGPRLVSTIVIEDGAALSVGMPLTADFDDSGRLVFRPAGKK